MTEQDIATDLPVVEEPVVTEEQKEELEAAPKTEEETHEQYGKRVQDRINKLTKKLRDTEREMETIKSTTRSDFEAMSQHNQELKEAIAAMTTTANVIAEQTKPKPIDVTKEIDSSIKGLKAKRLEAYDNADFKMIAMIDDQLDELKDRKYEAKMAQEIAKERETLEKKVTTAQKAETQLNPTIEAWVEDTPWYNDNSKEFDPAMQAAAIAIHGIVIKDPAWQSKTLRQQLNETKRRTEAKFNYGKNGSSPPTVEGVGTMSGGVKETVTLSDDQKYVAVRMFPNLTPKEAEKKYASALGK